MKTICAWCKKEKGEKPPYEDKEISHGICKECAEKMSKKHRRKVCYACDDTGIVIVDSYREVCPICEKE